MSNQYKQEGDVCRRWNSDVLVVLKNRVTYHSVAGQTEGAVAAATQGWYVEDLFAKESFYLHNVSIGEILNEMEVLAHVS